MNRVYQKHLAPALGRLGRSRRRTGRKFVGDVGSGRPKGLDRIELGTDLPRRGGTEAARVEAPIASQVKTAVVSDNAVESFSCFVARFDDLHDAHILPVPPEPRHPWMDRRE